jgi:hypothetical protein
MAKVLKIAMAIVCLAPDAAIGGITYRVTENSSACHEVHLGWMSVPREVTANNVDTGHCRYEMRSAGEAVLDVSAACQGAAWVPVREKFGVDLSKGTVHRISDTAWNSASPLRRNDGGIPPQKDEPGIRYKGGPLLKRSGPKWSGEGSNMPIFAALDPSLRRASVYSWDGFNIVYSFLDPTSFGRRSKVEGRYWIDIYEALSGQRLVKIEGSFKGISPDSFLGYAPAWYESYFVMPLGRLVDGGESMMLQKLLICDTDAASRKNNPGLKERK